MELFTSYNDNNETIKYEEADPVKNRLNNIYHVDFLLDYKEVYSLPSSSSDNSYSIDTDSVRFTITEYDSAINPILRAGRFGDFTIRRSYLAVLRQCSDKLNVLSNVFRPFVGNLEAKKLGYRTLNERFGANTQLNCDDFRITSTYTNFHKLQKLLRTLQSIFDKLHDEISRLGSFEILTKFIADELKMRFDEEFLLAQLKTQSNQMGVLRKVYERQKVAIKELEIKFDDVINDIKMELEDAREYFNAEVIYSRQWNRARRDQNRKYLDLNEGNLNFVITHHDWKIKQETRCHNEIARYLEESKNEFQDQIEHWMVEYDNGMDQKDQDIYNIKVDMEKLAEKRENLEVLLASRQIEIDNFVEYKRQKAINQARLMLERRAARIIQRWWRSIMEMRKLKLKVKKNNKKKKKGKK